MVWYALATYRQGAGTATALVFDDKLYDFATACNAVSGTPPSWATAELGGLIARWPEVQVGIESVAQAAALLAGAGKLKPLPAGTALAAPLRPGRIYCAAANYVEHAKEMSTALASKTNSRPYFFQKPSTTVIGPEEVVRKPEETAKLDWEVELAVVIGKRAKDVPLAQALDYIAGYTVANDISARDLNKRTDYPFAFDWFQGKCWDTFCPLGPWIVTPDEIPDPHDLKMELRVNGEVRQESHSGNMSVTIGQILSNFSGLTYSAGDVLSTGTVSGVAGFKSPEERARLYLKPGDVIEAEIERIGVLRNPVISWQEGHGTPPLPRIRPWGEGV